MLIYAYNFISKRIDMRNRGNCDNPSCSTKAKVQAACFKCNKLYCFQCSMKHAQ